MLRGYYCAEDDACGVRLREGLDGPAGGSPSPLALRSHTAELPRGPCPPAARCPAGGELPEASHF